MRRALVVVTGLMLALTACSHGAASSSRSPAPSPAGPPGAASGGTSVRLSDAGDASATTRDWTVDVVGASSGPGPAQAGPAVLSVQPGRVPADGGPLPGVRLGASPAQITLTGARLPPAGATLTRRLDHPAAANSALAYLDSPSGTWITVPTIVSADGRTLTATVHHFSLWTDLTSPDGVYYGVGTLFTKRIDAPDCPAGEPAWVSDAIFVSDINGPLLWCTGHDAKDPSLLVVKVRVNRAYGLGIRPAVTPVTVRSSLADDAGLQDLMTAGLTNVVDIPGALGRLLHGAVFATPGSETVLTFNQAQVRHLRAGTPLVTGDRDLDYEVAGALFNAIGEVAGPGHQTIAALFALAAATQCEGALRAAHSAIDIADALAGCVIDNPAAVRNLIIDLGARSSTADPKQLGTISGLLQKALMEVYAFKLGAQLGEALSDQGMDSAAFALTVFVRSLTVPATQLRASPGALGPAVIGRPAPAFAKALGRTLAPPQFSGTDTCWQRTMNGLPGVTLMTENDADSAVLRVDVSTPKIRTTKGTGVGSSEKQIKAAYPGQVVVQAHDYVPGGHYLIVHDHGKDLLFETGADGMVTSYRFGLPLQVSYVEGCA